MIVETTLAKKIAKKRQPPITCWKEKSTAKGRVLRSKSLPEPSRNPLAATMALKDLAQLQGTHIANSEGLGIPGETS